VWCMQRCNIGCEERSDAGGKGWEIGRAQHHACVCGLSCISTGAKALQPARHQSMAWRARNRGDVKWWHGGRNMYAGRYGAICPTWALREFDHHRALLAVEACRAVGHRIMEDGTPTLPRARTTSVDATVSRLLTMSIRQIEQHRQPNSRVFLFACVAEVALLEDCAPYADSCPRQANHARVRRWRRRSRRDAGIGAPRAPQNRSGPPRRWWR